MIHSFPHKLVSILWGRQIYWAGNVEIRHLILVALPVPAMIGLTLTLSIGRFHIQITQKSQIPVIFIFNEPGYG